MRAAVIHSHSEEAIMISNVRVGVAALAFLVAAAGGCDRANEGGQQAAPGGGAVAEAPAPVPVAAKATAAARAQAARAPAGAAQRAPAGAAQRAPAAAAAAAEGEGHDCGGDCGEGGGCEGAQKAMAEPPGADATVEDVKVGDAPARGPADAPVTVVIFSDFQCPFCVRGEAVIAELEKLYPGKLRVAYKHSPLPMHKNAKLAARAAIAADEQGKFWAYHDLLIANRNDLERPSLERFARELGLRDARFSAAIDSPRVEARLQADLDEAARLQVAGTPTIFVNGRRVIGAQPVEAFRAVIDKELERAGR
jgi:protein-disulfide isomerase